jgi:hypothetical protein
VQLNEAGRRKARNMIESSQYKRAAQNDYASVERAAEELLSLLDERAG